MDIVVSALLVVAGSLLSYFASNRYAREQSRDLQMELEITQRIAKREYLAILFRAYVKAMSNYASASYKLQPISTSHHLQEISRIQAATVLRSVSWEGFTEIIEKLEDIERTKYGNLPMRDVFAEGLLKFSEHLQTTGA